MSTQSNELTRAEYAGMETYMRVMERYSNLEMSKSVPIIAIRLLCLRFGYKNVLGGVMHQPFSSMVTAAVAEIDALVRFMKHLTGRFTPLENNRAGVEETIAEFTRLRSDPAVALSIGNFMRRMKSREANISQKPKMVQ
jgi:hypothetical protein